jgi:hypothetical protein
MISPTPGLQQSHLLAFFKGQALDVVHAPERMASGPVPMLGSRQSGRRRQAGNATVAHRNAFVGVRRVEHTHKGRAPSPRKLAQGAAPRGPVASVDGVAVGPLRAWLLLRAHHLDAGAD